MIAMIGISVIERLRDRGIDGGICFDDLTKHSKAYRQISLILGKIPSRDAFPSDIFNVHSSLLERCGKLNHYYFGGSITAFPIIETINSDITEFIATNVISITDGQYYTNRTLFLDSLRPAIDSGLSVSRIGSNAQCQLMKVAAVGIRNSLTNYRMMDLDTNSIEYFKLRSLNLTFFSDHLNINSHSFTIFLCLFYTNGMILFKHLNQINTITLLLGCVYFYFYYILSITSTTFVKVTFNYTKVVLSLLALML
jgi:hypothetical protein